MSKRYLTDYSYQCMDEYSSVDEKKSFIEDEIGNTNIGCFSAKINDNISISIEYDDLYLESGYYEGFRLEPTFYVELSLSDSYEPPEDFDCVNICVNSFYTDIMKLILTI